MHGGKHKTKQYLWRARRRKGLGLKQVAHLLEHRTVDQVSRYENGVRLPTLKTALKLEIIYGLPVRVLFKELHKQLRREIELRAGAASANDQVSDVISDYCSFTELVNSTSVSSETRQRIHRHAADLINQMNRSPVTNGEELSP